MSVTTILRCRWIGTLVAGFIALSVAILAALLLPGQAEAQEQATPKTTTKLVEPGDSLWTIAQTRLSPDAAPQQVAEEAGRIYALNQDQLGDNPNLLLVGQELVVSPVVGEEPRAGEPAVSEEPLVAEQQAPEPIVAESKGVFDAPAAEGAVSEDVVPSTLPTPDSTDEQAESAPTTTAGGIVGSLLEAYDNLKVERRLLGLGIIALTLIIAALMLWRLPMRRNVEAPAAWGIPREYYENYTPPEASPEATKGPEGEPSSPASPPPTEEATREPSTPSSATSQEDHAVVG